MVEFAQDIVKVSALEDRAFKQTLVARILNNPKVPILKLLDSGFKL